MSETRCSADAMRDWVTAVFQACGVRGDDAHGAAVQVVRTSLRGIDTHGVARLPSYVDRLLRREVNPLAVPERRLLPGGMAVEAQGGLGQVVVPWVIRSAIAAGQGAVACSIANCGHLGALGTLLLEACEAGCVALLCQKTPPIMALPGAAGAAIGNNPIAFAAPVPGGDPLVFDTATSIVARGHVVQAQREGRPLPEGWAIGPDGEPTTDPAAALRGAMRPLAGHKGMGLAMMVEVLAGCLSGMSHSASAHDPAGSASGVSAFLLVVDPARFDGREAYDAAMRGWIDHYLQASGPEARYPGQRQAQCERQRQQEGIPVPETLIAELRAAGDRVGVSFENVLSRSTRR